MGPKTESCGKPLNTSIQSERLPLIPTFRTLHLNHWRIQSNNLLVMPWACSFKSSLLSGTLSKAFAKSSNITSTPSSVCRLPVTWTRKANKFIHGVSRASQSRSTVPESADSRCRPAGASPTTVIVITVTSRSIFPSVYRWEALVSCIAASILWNSLPLDIQSSPSLTVFCHWLKTFLFHKSFHHIP